MALIFLWYLMTTPADKIICTLWVKEPPTTAALVTACGFSALGKYRIDVVPLNSNKVSCSRPAESLLWIMSDCGLPLSMDQYTIRIVYPEFTELLCSVAVEHEGQPTNDEIQTQCGNVAFEKFLTGKAGLKFMRSAPKPSAEANAICAAPDLPVGLGLYDQAPDAHSLWTDDPLTWLAGRLIWFGVVRPTCKGGTSGLDPETLAANGCGMDAARGEISKWQNQWDADIYAAAADRRIPARLLKRMIAVESQFWPLFSNENGETGLLQVSPNGADVMLRYDADLDPNYPKLKVQEQYWKRLEILNGLTCISCSLDMAVKHMRVMMPMYARLLAAYRCRSVEMNAALSGREAWRQAVMDYNGSADYLRKVEQ